MSSNLDKTSKHSQDTLNIQLDEIPLPPPPPQQAQDCQQQPSNKRSFDGVSAVERKRKKKKPKTRQVDDNLMQMPRGEEEEMLKKLGFASFNSTKGKKVEGNNVGAVHVVKKRNYRQYMNRKGGFNRPLDKVA